MLDEPERQFSLWDHVLCLGRREILVLIPIYCLGLMPATTAGALLIARLERAVGLPSLADWLPHSIRLAILVGCLVLGGLIVSFSYTWLVLEGGGGPVPPFSARTRRLVTTGPYALMRHPSVWGKLLGVLGLGVYIGSITFLTVVIPFLLYWSLSWNNRRMDEAMERAFGDAYRAYRDRTPRMVPRAVRRLLGAR